MLAFVERKFNMLYDMLKSPAAKQHINASILGNGAPTSNTFVTFVDAVYRRYVFGIVADYLDAASTAAVHAHLGIVNVPLDMPPLKV